MSARRDACAAEMNRIGTELAELNIRREALFRERTALWQVAGDLGFTQAQMAAATQTTEGAVTQALRKATIRAATRKAG